MSAISFLPFRKVFGAGTFAGLVLALLTLYVPSFSYASECISWPEPMVGLIEEVSADNRILTTKTFTFPRSSLVKPGEQVINLDGYESIAREYQANDHSLPKPNRSLDRRRFSVPQKILEHLSTQEILVSGPPGNVCRMGFAGLVSRDGRLRYASVDQLSKKKDAAVYEYSGYRLRVHVEGGDYCDKTGPMCRVVATFTLNDHAFRLFPKESYFPKGTPIKSITLLHAWRRYPGRFGIFDPGVGYQLAYLIVFRQPETGSPQAPIPE